jgi:hypothetical protein
MGIIMQTSTRLTSALRRPALFLVTLPLLGLCGCDEVLPASERVDCGTARIEFDGAWSITGEGTRDRCTDPTMNGPIRLRSLQNWLVVPLGGSIDASMWIDTRTEGATIASVQTNNTCLSFEFAERVQRPTGPDELRMRWSARTTDGGRTLHGTFGGSYATSTCRVYGEFVMERR